MTKNIVICCDGTANEFAIDRTNVVKLYQTLVEGSEQVVYYHPGLGTMEPPGAFTGFSKWVMRTLGQAFGYGLAADIRDAHVFLMGSYEPGDKLFMFGFSRGAYTVRCIASLLKLYGLIPKGNEALVPYAIRMFKDLGDRADEDRMKKYFKLAHDFKSTFGHERSCKPYFIGLWDTVSSVGWIDNQLALPYTGNNPDIEIGRHAVAIDERRAFFRTNLWQPKSDASAGGPRDLKQVWFPGVHCDVGGGYAEATSRLATNALKWMLDEAIVAGLKIDPGRLQQILDVPRSGERHESLRGIWWVGEVLFKRHYDWSRKEWLRRMNCARPRTIPPKSLIHRSAYQQEAGYERRLPADAQVVD